MARFSISIETLESAKKVLKSAEKKSTMLSATSAVQQLYPVLKEKKQKGFTDKDLIEILNGAGVPITMASFKKAMQIAADEFEKASESRVQSAVKKSKTPTETSKPVDKKVKKLVGKTASVKEPIAAVKAQKVSLKKQKPKATGTVSGKESVVSKPVKPSTAAKAKKTSAPGSAATKTKAVKPAGTPKTKKSAKVESSRSTPQEAAPLQPTVTSDSPAAM